MQATQYAGVSLGQEPQVARGGRAEHAFVEPPGFRAVLTALILTGMLSTVLLVGIEALGL